MFLFLLGLKTRLMRWPVATLVLLVGTCGFSIFQFPKTAVQAETVKSLAVQSGVWQARKEAAQQLCSGRFQAQQCQFLNTLKPSDYANLDGFFKEYKRTHADDKSPELKKWTKWLANEDFTKSLEPEVKGTPAVAAYETALKNYRGLLAADGKKTQTLMRGNIRPLPAVKALFRHEGWLDLVASMLVFALFAAFLEQRMGFVGVMLVYFIGGMGGNFLQTAFIPFGSALQGSAAAVSAVLGAFLIYFHQEKSYLGINLGRVFRRTLVFPAWAYVFVWLSASELVNMVSGSWSGHLAHGVGFALGAIVASMQKDLFPLKITFLFPHEQAMYYQAKQSNKFDEKMELFQKIYHLNRESFYSFRNLFSYFEKHHLSLNSFKEEDRELVTNILLECFRYSGKNEKHTYSQQVLGLVPLWWNLNSLDLEVEADAIIDRANEFHAQGFLVQGLRYYDFFLEKYAAHPRAQQAHSVVMELFDELEKFDIDSMTEMLLVLTDYAKAHPTTHFQSQIKNLAFAVEKESGNAA